MQLSILVTTYDQESNLVEIDNTRCGEFTPRELADLLRYELFSGRLSNSHVALTPGTDLTNTYLVDSTFGEGTRDAIEKGYRSELSVHYDTEQPARNKKYWRKMLALLEANDRIIH